MVITDSTSSSDTQANAISIKPPVFMATNPDAWFTVLEAQFHLANISADITKFYHALAALPPEIVAKLHSTTLSSHSYDTLKEKIKEQHEASKPEILDQFLRDKPMVGRPSHYLAEMEQLANKVGVNEDLVRHKFQQALPSNLAPIIASMKNTPLNDLGKLADELHAFSNGSVNSVPSSVPKYSKNYQKNTPQINRGITPFSPDQRPKVCRAHIFFADKARTCRHWCRWPNKANCKILNSNVNTPNTSPNPSRSSSPDNSRSN